jgi:hypothetical protein
MMLTQSPGPGTYPITEDRSLGLGAPVFGSEERDFSAHDNGVPGPGAHKQGDIYKQSTVPNLLAYSIGANLRSDPINPMTRDFPGPGMYKHLEPLLKHTSGIPSPKSMSMGPGSTNKAGGRAVSATRPRQLTNSSFVSPGPGAYHNPLGALETGPGRGVTIKGKHDCKLYHGPGADQEFKGMESPGPGQDLRGMVSNGGHVRFVGYAFANTKGSPEGTRHIVKNTDKQFISHAHSASMTGGDSPGPLYNVANPRMANSKHRNSGSFSFGSGGRTNFAKLTV